jgi:hypothetical protein
MTVTMLGAPGSGKTTFMLGMYAALASGRNGFFMQAESRDVEREIALSWNAIADTGSLPFSTREPRRYPMVFKDGPTPVALVDWHDYRGGVMSERQSNPEAASLLERLRTSHSVYVMIDGARLRESIDGMGHLRTRMVSTERVSIGRIAEDARRITTVLHIALRDRDIYPSSLVFVVTKADLLTDVIEDFRSWLIEVVRELFPIAFGEGINSLVVPVTVGHFGPSPDVQTVDPGSVNPIGVDSPIMGSMAWFLRQSYKPGLADILHAENERLANTIAHLFDALHGLPVIVDGSVQLLVTSTQAVGLRP